MARRSKEHSSVNQVLQFFTIPRLLFFTAPLPALCGHNQAPLLGISDIKHPFLLVLPKKHKLFFLAWLKLKLKTKIRFKHHPSATNHQDFFLNSSKLSRLQRSERWSSLRLRNKATFHKLLEVLGVLYSN